MDVELLKALADESRLRILNLLMSREMCVCELEEVLGMSQSNVSRHLNRLRQSKVIEVRREAQWAYYRVSDDFSSCHGLLLRYLQEQMETQEDYRKERDVSGSLDQNTRCARE